MNLRHPEGTRVKRTKRSSKLAGEVGFELGLHGPELTKRCSRCGKSKPLDDFYRRSRSSDGHTASCKSCINKYRQQLYENPCQRQARHEKYLRERDEVRLYNHDKNQQLKMLLIAHYSNNTNRCACCGESDIRFLTIDHINGNGSKYHKSIGCRSGATFYRWLRKEGMPEGYQALCYNCNIAGGRYGICPHKAVGTNNARGSQLMNEFRFAEWGSGDSNPDALRHKGKR